MSLPGYYRHDGPAGEQAFVATVPAGAMLAVPACPHCGVFRMVDLVIQAGGQLTVSGGVAAKTITNCGTITMAAAAIFDGGSGAGATEHFASKNMGTYCLRCNTMSAPGNSKCHWCGHVFGQRNAP